MSPLFLPGWLGPLILYGSLLLHLMLLVLPGLALGCLWRRARTLFGLLVCSPILAYLSFWIFFASKPGGKLFSIALFTSSLAVVLARRSTAFRIVRSQQIPLLLMALVALTHLTLFAWYGDPHHKNVQLANFRFTTGELAGDNIIPYLFAGRIYAHAPLRPFCCDGWLTSDRPPLQTGLALLVQPVRPAPVALEYQEIGTLAQCLWLPGAWALLGTLGISRRQRIRLLLLLATTGFVFFNSVFVWPKLLAAGFVLFALTEMSRNRLVSAALAVGLALLAHPGSAFSLPVLVLLFGRRVRPAQMPAVALVVTLMIAPWLLYQKFVDPPGNRLTKMHLAAVGGIDNRSLGQALRDAYSSQTIQAITDYKLSNLRFLVGPEPWHLLALTPASAQSLRRIALVHIWQALGLLNIGWLLIPMIPPVLRKVMVAALLNLFLWCLILFGPRGTAAAHASYCDLLLLALGLGAALIAVPKNIRDPLFFLWMAALVVNWVLLPDQSLQWPYVLASIPVLAAVMLTFVRPEYAVILRRAPLPRLAR